MRTRVQGTQQSTVGTLRSASHTGAQICANFGENPEKGEANHQHVVSAAAESEGQTDKRVNISCAAERDDDEHDEYCNQNSRMDSDGAD